MRDDRNQNGGMQNKNTSVVDLFSTTGCETVLKSMVGYGMKNRKSFQCYRR